MKQRTIVVGDIHGCIEEFDELLRVVEYTKRDRLLLLGDLVDRGPDPVGVVRRARELGADSVLGNHEEKHLRWRRHERKVKATPGYKNPMRPFTGDRLAEHNAYTEADWEWIEKLPVTIEFEECWIAVHAGFEPAVSLKDQRADKMLRVRYVDEAGKMRPIKSDVDQPAGTHRWATRWGYPHHVVYGHHAVSMAHPHVDRFVAQNGELHRADREPRLRVALDTACVFGGTLSAMIFPYHGEPEVLAFESVPCRRKYAEVWAGDE